MLCPLRVQSGGILKPSVRSSLFYQGGEAGLVFRAGSVAPVSFLRGQLGSSPYHVWGSGQSLTMSPAGVGWAWPQQPHAICSSCLFAPVMPSSFLPSLLLSLNPLQFCTGCSFSIFEHGHMALGLTSLHFVFGGNRGRS